MIYISLLFLFLGVFLLLFTFIIMPRNRNYPTRRQEEQRYCVLIPARNESKVIESLLLSIENQSRKIKPEDVYVIVEDLNDLTVSIVKKHKMNIVLRKDLSKRRKGYALDDAIKEILEDKKKYTAYFIIDADNVLDKNFIKRMSEDIEKGYDIGVGYRNTKNGNNLVACASALLFSLLNSFANERKCKYSNTVTISGTGFFIRGDIIEKLGGYPFNTLTEDYELSLYSSLNNLTTTYNKNACFYDEQPEDLNTSIVQRTRWVKGYFEARGKYISKIKKSIKVNNPNYASKIIDIIGVNPMICLLIGAIFYLLHVIISYSFSRFILALLLMLLFIYVVLVLLTYILIRKEDKLNIKVSKIKLLLYNPVFLVSFVPCFFKAIFSRNLEWKAIPHDKELEL